MKKILILGATLALMAGVLVGCGGAPQATEAAQSATAALKITGSVATESSWTEAELQAMDTAEADYTGKDGTTTTYTGVPLDALLEQAGVAAGATTLVLVADDDYTAEVALADVEGCENCIVAFQDGGGLRTVLPDLSGKAQVKDLVEIQVQ